MGREAVCTGDAVPERLYVRRSDGPLTIGRAACECMAGLTCESEVLVWDTGTGAGLDVFWWLGV